jgi:uncharacterized membrane protein YbhN (UPF0104 family)
MIARWLPLLAVQAPAIESAKAAKSYLAATFTNYFLPAIGPDLLRAASLGRPHRAVAEVGASIAAERMLGAAASVMMVLLALHIGLPAVVGIPELSSLTLVIPIALAGGFLLSFQPTFRTSLRHPAVRRFARLAHRFSDALLAYRHVPLTMLGVWLLTVAGVFFPIATLWILARSLGIDISPQALFVAVPISEFVAKVPISFAAIGTREATMISLLVTFGVQPDGALALAILSRAIDVLIAIPGVLALRELWHDLGTRPSIVGTAPRDAN